MNLLENILTADTRRELIIFFATHQNEKQHLRNLSRILGKQVNAVSRELYNLSNIGLLLTESIGKKKYFYINKDFILFDDLVKIVYKTTGLGQKIIEHKDEVGKIDIAIITYNYIYNVHKGQYDIDLLLVGEVNISATSHLIKEVEVALKRDIKYTVMPKQEFDFRMKKRDIFIENILSNENIVLMGKNLIN